LLHVQIQLPFESINPLDMLHPQQKSLAMHEALTDFTSSQIPIRGAHYSGCA